MSESDREPEHLLQRLHQEREKLRDEIAQMQGRARSAQRAAGLMALVTALGAAGLVYPTIFLENYFSAMPKIIIDINCALVAGALISLLSFASLASLYRKKLRRSKEACHQMADRHSKSRLVQSDNATLPTTPIRTDDAVGHAGIIQVAAATGDLSSNVKPIAAP